MNNPALRDQLKAALKTGKIKVKYPDGYKAWKQKFDFWFSQTKNVNQTLDIMYGQGGGVNNYQGSILANSNFKLEPKTGHKKQHNPKRKKEKSKVFNFIKKDEKK